MSEEPLDKKAPKRKSFFSRLIDKLDKKLEEKSKSKPCCCVKPQDKQKSPCS